MTGRLKGRGKIGEGTHRYHRGKGRYSRHYPSRDAKRKHKRGHPRKLKSFPARSRRNYRHIAD